MRLRGGPVWGGFTYYRLIGSVHTGEPVQLGDASLRGPHGKRGGDLIRYAGPEYTIQAAEPQEKGKSNEQDSTPNP